MSKIYLDTEFIEDGTTIDLVSIGLIKDTGETLYLLNAESDWSKADQWVKDNVIAQLPQKPKGLPLSAFERKQGWRSRKEIAEEIVSFVGNKPQFWADYASYDWIVLCQLFGRMIDLPAHFPMYCNDLRQLVASMGHPKLPEQGEGLHNALADAVWLKETHEFLIKKKICQCM